VNGVPVFEDCVTLLLVGPGRFSVVNYVESCIVEDVLQVLLIIRPGLTLQQVG